MNIEPTGLPEHKRGSSRAYALPPAVDLAQRILDGETVDEVATSLHITTIALVRRLNKSGYSATGEVLAAKKPTPAAKDFAFSFQEWMADSDCADIGGDLWYSSDAMERAVAITVCRTCPVRQKCLDYAMQTEAVTDGLPAGIWGGLTSGERHKLAKKEAKAAKEAAA